MCRVWDASVTVGIATRGRQAILEHVRITPLVFLLLQDGEEALPHGQGQVVERGGHHGRMEDDILPQVQLLVDVGKVLLQFQPGRILFSPSPGLPDLRQG